MVSSHLLGASLAVAVALCLTGQAIAIRFGTREARATDALAAVFCLNVVSFGGVVAFRSFPAYTPTIQSLAMFVAAGVVGTLLGTGFYYVGIEHIGASRSDAIKASQPLTATILAVVVLDETVTALNGLGVILVVAGVAVLVSEWSNRSLADAGVNVGLAYPLLASIFFGMEPTFAKLGFRLGTPIFVGLFVKTLTATVGLLAFLRWREGLTAVRLTDALSSRWFFAAGVANTLSLVAYYDALSVAPVAVVMPITQTSPLLVMALSYRYLPRLERVTARVVVGGFCIVGGAVFVVLFG